MTSSKRVKAWPVKVQAEVFQVISDLLVVGFSVRHAIEFCELIFIKQQAHLRQINQDLRAGQSVSEAFGTVIDEQIRFQLKLAEEHGQLASSLGQISRLLQTAHQRQQKNQAVATVSPGTGGYLSHGDHGNENFNHASVNGIGTTYPK
ncbi:type II secretion system F family protein [Secundilactobacillus odoratitofui]|uniref:type II secretion system F family protein n=1 Tax=Secundilactobacillus odoratitofui TaxID=480930 RepID=UPI0020933DBA|nr:type II secretion system F family protein [Secundilactobacillus odoratitofui]